MKARLSKGSGKQTETINISPLIDMVFILLIFFIVTTVFVEEKGMAMNTPDVAPPTTEDTKPIIVELRENGAIYFEGKEVGLAGLTGVLGSKAANDGGSVLIRSEETVVIQRIAEVMDICRTIGAKKTVLNVERK